MKKISISLALLLSFCFRLSAQTTAPFALNTTLTSTNVVTSTSGAQQVTQDNSNGYIGIGVDPTGTNCGLAVSNINFPSAQIPDIIMGIGNVVSGTTTYGSSTGSFACLRVDNSSSHNPLSIDFIVDNQGLVGIGSIASLGSGGGFAHLYLTDPDPVGTIPLMRVVTNAATDAFFIGSNGNVGIGTVSPGYKLDVAGVANFQNSIAIAQNSYTSGTTYQFGNLYTAGIADFNSAVNISGNVNMPLGGTANGYVLQSDAYGNAHWANPSASGISYWTLATNGTDLFNNNSGNIGIGTNNPQAKLDVQGTVRIGTVSTPNPLTDGGYGLYVQYGILTERVKVALYGNTPTSWSDYVFDDDYKLESLADVEKFIKKNHHLPGVPSTDDVHCDGIDMAEMDATLLKKIEELTLYVLALKKENEEIKKQISNK